jgi:AAA domain
MSTDINKEPTKEQREAWQKQFTGPGLYNVDGEQAYRFLGEVLEDLMVTNTMDKVTTAVIGGDEKDQFDFATMMHERGVVDLPNHEPDLFFFRDREHPDGEVYPRSLNSQDDTEDVADFIRHSKSRGYNRVGAVVVLYPPEGETKHIDRILKVSQLMNGVTRYIEVPVFVVNRAEFSNFEKVSNNTTPSGVKHSIEIEWGHTMKPESVEWLVPEFIPLHQTTAFSGEMDTRKSTAAISIAASGSLMGQWFMGTENVRKPFITLVAADEDTYTTTVLPRFIAAGGYRPHLGCLKLNVKCRRQAEDGWQEWETPLSFDEHLNLLGETIEQTNKTQDFKVGLLINDPIISFFGNKNYNSSQDSRDIMRGLKKLCEELKITIINICHFNKTQGLTAKQKTSGAKALIEAHRMAWAFDLMEDDPTTTLIAPIKHNLMRDAKSYKITTDDTPIKFPIGNRQHQKDNVGVIRFVGYSNMTADERIEEKESKDRGNRKEVKKAILDVLKDGPKPAGQVCNQLQDVGSVRTIQRAAEQLVEEGRLRKSGNNRKNMVWELATEVKQTTFDEVTTNGRV